MLDDVRRLANQTTNEGRTEALLDLVRKRNIPVTVESFTIDKPRGSEPRTEGRNLVATFGDGARHIVVGAHYDAARLPDRSLSKGAVDNAASSAILIRLADALMRQKPAARVSIVWFDMEELGLIGSARYVEARKSNPPAAMINLDINASGDTVIWGGRRSPGNAANRRALVETCAARDQVCVEFPQMPPGDDRSFAAAGIPELSLALVPAIEAHQLWLVMTAGKASGLAPDAIPETLKVIHTAADTAEKVDEAAMTRVLEFTQALLQRIASQ